MYVNISISYILYNNNIIVNLYKLHFLSSIFPSNQIKMFSTKPNLLYSPTFPLLQPNGPYKMQQIEGNQNAIM